MHSMCTFFVPSVDRQLCRTVWPISCRLFTSFHLEDSHFHVQVCALCLLLLCFILPHPICDPVFYLMWAAQINLLAVHEIFYQVSEWIQRSFRTVWLCQPKKTDTTKVALWKVHSGIVHWKSTLDQGRHHGLLPLVPFFYSHHLFHNKKFSIHVAQSVEHQWLDPGYGEHPRSWGNTCSYVFAPCWHHYIKRWDNMLHHVLRWHTPPRLGTVMLLSWGMAMQRCVFSKKQQNGSQISQKGDDTCQDYLPCQQK